MGVHRAGSEGERKATGDSDLLGLEEASFRHWYSWSCYWSPKSVFSSGKRKKKRETRKKKGERGV